MKQSIALVTAGRRLLFHNTVGRAVMNDKRDSSIAQLPWGKSFSDCTCVSACLLSSLALNMPVMHHFQGTLGKVYTHRLPTGVQGDTDVT
jgi:hypothetical protein